MASFGDEPTIPRSPKPEYTPGVRYTGLGAGSERTNKLAILALVLSIIGSFVGLILGYIARSQIRRTGERGAGLALAAIVIGWIGVALFLGIIIFATSLS